MMKDTPESERDLLRSRARALAAPAKTQTPAGRVFDVIEFTLAGERYAVETSCVVEVQPLQHLTPLPGTPPVLLGIINVRGHILAVIDLKRFFDLPAEGISDLHRVIVLRQGDVELGILADQVVGNLSVREEDLHADLPSLKGIRSDFLRGVDANRLTVLHASRILQDPRLVIDQHAPASPSS